MSGDGEIVTEVVTDALVLPETALRYRGDQIYVETVVRASAASIVEKDVTIGIVDGTSVQILSGIEAGDEDSEGARVLFGLSAPRHGGSLCK